MTRVLVVDDSQFMRTVIGDILADHGYDVRRAPGGEAAVEAVQEYNPDIVTMDVEMPGVDGIEAVKRIMATHPTRILMLSAHTEAGAEATLEALDYGAVDFLAKPSGEVSTDIVGLADRLVETVEAVEQADLDAVASAGDDGRKTGQADSATVATNGGTDARSATPATPGSGRTTAATGQGTADSDGATATAPTTTAGGRGGSRDRSEHPTIVVGASTGGPKVVQSIVSELPTGLGARVLVVQHMPPSFTGRLAARLDELSGYTVSEADDRMRVGPDEVVIAKGGYHMEVVRDTLGKLRLRLTERERRHGVRPSLDVTMETAAETVAGPLVGVTLTGMGQDGAAGTAAIASAGGTTIAQDRASSAVYGMPGAAIETGCVDAVLPASEIPTGIVSTLTEDP